jgi:hypothetical protein
MSYREMLLLESNRQAVEEICSRVLQEIDPEEANASLNYVDLVVEMVIHDEGLSLSSEDRPGGLGPVELTTILIVPVVVKVVGDLLVELGKIRVEEIEVERREARKLRTVTYEDIEPIIKSLRPHSTKREMRQLAEIVARVIEEYLKENE